MNASEFDKMSGEKFWEIIHNKYGPGLLTVSMPIFNRDFTKAYIRFGYSCGELCGGGEDMIIEKIGDKWTVSQHLGGWQS